MELNEYIRLQVILLRQVGIELAGIDIVDSEVGHQLRNFLWLAFTESGMAKEVSVLYSDLNFWGTGVRHGHDPKEQDPIQCARELLENHRASNPDSPFPVLEELLTHLENFAPQEV